MTCDGRLCVGVSPRQVCLQGVEFAAPPVHRGTRGVAFHALGEGALPSFYGATNSQQQSINSQKSLPINNKACVRNRKKEFFC